MSVVMMNGTETISSEFHPDANILQDELSIDKLYENFSLQACDLPEVMDTFQALKTKLDVENMYGLELYRELKAKLGARNSKTWKAREVLNMLEKRANQKEYLDQKAAKGIRVLIVGAGPTGLRLAIDCILLGAEVVIIEKRQTFSRNNVLHLWPFTIEDLKQLGAKKFYGKFCAGAIDHISIRSLQCILLKLCLLLGVKIYTGVEFLEILEPTDQIGWHASVDPEDHPVSQFEFDFIVGAEGARKSRMPGFDRKELRGKLALAITANFKNYYSRDEAAVEEISGVAFIFNQKFFKDLKADTDIDLENIVYYKDDTHYFVMTAKKASLMSKGVLKEDCSDTVRLLSRENIDEGKLWDYAIEAAAWSTELPRLDFAFNHHKKPDVALFDFTSIHQAEYAARAIRRGGKDLFLCLIGDALLEPFWPTGTGCARGFLGAMDTAWMIRGAGQGKKVLDLLCERECIFQRLPQTTPEKLQQNIKAYTIDPQSRYPNLHFHRVRPASVQHLYGIDDLSPSPVLKRGSVRVKKTSGIAGGEGEDESEVLASKEDMRQPVSPTENNKENIPSTPGGKEAKVVTSPGRKPLMDKGEVHRAYYVNIDDDSLHTLRDHRALIKWLQKQVQPYGIEVTNLSTSWSSGMALCALIHRYRPDIMPNFKELKPENSVENNQLAFSLAEKHLAISSLIKPTEMKKPDKLALFTYLSLFYELFEDADPVEQDQTSSLETVRELSPLREEDSEELLLTSGEVMSSPERSLTSSITKKKSKKRRPVTRRNTKKSLATSPSSVERSWSSKSFQRPNITPPTSPTGKVAAATPSTLTVKENKDQTSTAPKTPKSSRSRPLSSAGGSQFKISAPDSSDFCYFCGKRVYLMERMSANGLFFHRNCFKCSHCNCKLKMGNYSLSKGEGGEKGKFFCSVHYRQLFMSNPEAINYSRANAPKRDTSKTDLSAEKANATQTQQETTKTSSPVHSEKEGVQREQSPEQIHVTPAEEETQPTGEVSKEVMEPAQEEGLEEKQNDEREKYSETELTSEEGHEVASDDLEKEDDTVIQTKEDTYEEEMQALEEVFVIAEEDEEQESDLQEEEETRMNDVTEEEPQCDDRSDKVTSEVTVGQESSPPVGEPEQQTNLIDIMTETGPTPTDVSTETSSTPTDITTETSPTQTDITTVISSTSTVEKRRTPKPARRAPAPPLNKQKSKESSANSPKETRTTPKPARKAPPPPVHNHVAINNSDEVVLTRSNSKQEDNTVTSPVPKPRSLSEPKAVSESVEPRTRSRLSRSRSSSLENDENIHRVLQQEDMKQLANDQDPAINLSNGYSSVNTKSASNTKTVPARPAPYLPQSNRKNSGSPAPPRPAPYRQASGSPAPVRPAPYCPPSSHKASGNAAPPRPAPPSGRNKSSGSPASTPQSDRKGSGSPAPARPPPPSGRKESGSPAPVRPVPYRPRSQQQGPERPAPYRAGASYSPGIVKRLSMGYEQLQVNAKETEIKLGTKGREMAKANLNRTPTAQELPPYKQLGVVSEETNPANLPRPVSPNSFRRARSPCEWKGTLGRSRQPLDEVYHIPRSSEATSISNRYTWSRKPKRGQRSVTRSMFSSYASSDVAIQDRRKQQRRFREAQLIQREMSQLERQYDELEEVGRDIENALRDSEDSMQEDHLMKSWIGLVNERNGLVRKTAELSLKMKELELEDRQYEVDKELAELSQIPGHEMTKQELKRFEELCEQKLKVVEERNEIVMQTEEERVRELEEDETTNVMFDKQFGGSGANMDGEETSSDEDDQKFREKPQQTVNSRKNSLENGVTHKSEKRRSNRLSGLLSFFSSK